MSGIWRSPANESTDLYPGLTVWDAQNGGAISLTEGRSPVWAFIYGALVDGWGEVADDYATGPFTSDLMGSFLVELLNVRGEFGRLLLVLADVERSERESAAWWEDEEARARVAAQLRLCLRAIEEPEGMKGP